MSPESGGCTITVREFDVDRRRPLSVRTVEIAAATPVDVGREAALLVGAEPPDAGVSRVALTVTREDGWLLRVRNRNGAVVHPWGQAPQWVDGDATVHRSWPRVGVRLVGFERNVEHWVLLDAADAVAPPHDAAARVPGPTRQPDLPKPLTVTQSDAVHAVFREFLGWPPISGPVPVPLAAAASRLGISSTALQERLSRVQDRAYALGLHRQVGVSDPSYVHLLVRFGYIRSPLQAAGRTRSPQREMGDPGAGR